MEDIPGPKGYPIIGNMFDVADKEAPLKGLEHLADVYGPVYKVNILGRRTIVATGADVLKEVTDEKNFIKMPPQAIADKSTVAAGLFTAQNEDPDWHQAHRILIPEYGPIKIEGMFDGMKDIANQLVLKWARKDPEEPIMPTDDFTRLTLDTIALCTMNYRFNSFYQDGLHPFVEAMIKDLALASKTSTQTLIVAAVMKWWANPKENNALMRRVGQQIIDDRRANPVEKDDFLNALLYKKDPRTGEAMRDDLIVSNMLTFLIAGHETTSGLLSFAVHGLLRNPDAYRKAQEEVDSVIGDAKIEVHHLRKLKYLDAVLKESLRLHATAPGLSKKINPALGVETFPIAGGKYQVNKDDRILLLLAKAMQDPKVFGEDADQFRPDRMLDGNPEFERYQQYWKPFGNGSRSCIGRAFAIQEALLCLAIVLQNFTLKMDDPNYQMKIIQTLTVKPVGFKIRAALRNGMTATELELKLHKLNDEHKAAIDQVARKTAAQQGEGGELTILYGSNAGTCQALASKLASEASSQGVKADVAALDDRVNKLSTSCPTVIVTCSYEGEPPDNARHFASWIKCLSGEELKDVKYAVFGVGHKDWSATFHRIPRLIDEKMAAAGATRLTDLGTCDCSEGSPTNDFEDWVDSTLMPALDKESPKKSGDAGETEPQAEISTTGRASALRHDVQVGTVKNVTLLTAQGEPPKYHMEIALPPDTDYECGDYLAVLPQNPEVNVRKIMAHYELPLDSTITLTSPSFAPLPLNTSVGVADLLRSYVELSQPATKRSLGILMKHTTDEQVKAELSKIAGDDSVFQSKINSPRTPIFDILAKHPEIKLPLPTFLSLLLPLSVRQYSISSSPLGNPETCTLTFSVLSSATQKHPFNPDQLKIQNRSDNEENIFYGVATNYLASLKVGDRIQCSVRKTAKSTFRLPLDAETTPLLMFCAGTGLAPFRGFLQQRAVQKQANPDVKLALAAIFIGCRSATRDRLYAHELEEWSKLGIVQLKYAFSEEPEHALAEGCKRVGERMILEKSLMQHLWRNGARVYVCGSRGVADDVRKAADDIIQGIYEKKKAAGENMTPEDLKTVKERIQQRSANDIFD